jgi:hypothetical protein
MSPAHANVSPAKAGEWIQTRTVSPGKHRHLRVVCCGSDKHSEAVVEKVARSGTKGFDREVRQRQMAGELGAVIYSAGLAWKLLNA